MKICFRVVALVFAFSFTAPAVAQNWTSYTSPQGRYSALMPAAGATEEVSDKTDGGLPYTVRMATVVDRQLGIIALAGCSEYSPRYNMDVEGELKANVDNFINGIKGTQLTVRRTGYLRGGVEMLPATEFTAEIAEHNVRGIFLVIDKRACGAMMLYRKGDDRTVMIEKFIGSLDVKR